VLSNAGEVFRCYGVAYADGKYAGSGCKQDFRAAAELRWALHGRSIRHNKYSCGCAKTSAHRLRVGWDKKLFCHLLHGTPSEGSPLLKLGRVDGSKNGGEVGVEKGGDDFKAG
jgi:hypothetical protein